MPTLQYLIGGSSAIAILSLAENIAPTRLFTSEGDEFEKLGSYLGTQICVQDFEAYPPSDDTQELRPKIDIRPPKDIDIIAFDQDVVEKSKRPDWPDVYSEMEKAVMAHLAQESYGTLSGDLTRSSNSSTEELIQGGYGGILSIDSSLSRERGKLISAIRAEIRAPSGQIVSVYIDSPDSIIEGKVRQLLNSLDQNLFYETKRFAETENLFRWAVGTFSYDWVEDLFWHAVGNEENHFRFTFFPFSDPKVANSLVGRMFYENFSQKYPQFNELVDLSNRFIAEGYAVFATDLLDYAIRITGALDALNDEGFKITVLVDDLFLRAGGNIDTIKGFLDVIKEVDDTSEILELYNRIKQLTIESGCLPLPFFNEYLPWVTDAGVRVAVSELLQSEKLTPSEKILFIKRLTQFGYSSRGPGYKPFNIREKGDSYNRPLEERRASYFNNLASLIKNGLNSDDISTFDRLSKMHDDFMKNILGNFSGLRVFINYSPKFLFNYRIKNCIINLIYFKKIIWKVHLQSY